MFNSVFVLVSVLNGYKNIEGVYSNKALAETAHDELKGNYKFDRHELYICEYKLD